MSAEAAIVGRHGSEVFQRFPLRSSCSIRAYLRNIPMVADQKPRLYNALRPQYFPHLPKVGRGSALATELIKFTNGAEPTFPVLAAPLDEMHHAVPARASAANPVGDGNPSSAVIVVVLLHRGRWWGIVGVLTFVGMQVAGLLISATFSLRVGEDALSRAETMPYWRRLLAVLILRMVSTSEQLFWVGQSFALMRRP